MVEGLNQSGSIDCNYRVPHLDLFIREVVRWSIISIADVILVVYYQFGNRFPAAFLHFYNTKTVILTVYGDKTPELALA